MVVRVPDAEVRKERRPYHHGQREDWYHNSIEELKM